MSGQPFFVPSVIVIVVSIPLVLRLVPPNRIYGVRTRRTLSSPEVWYPANRFGGIALIVASAVYLEVARLLPYTKGAPDDLHMVTVHLIAWVGPLALAIVAIGLYTRRL